MDFIPTEELVKWLAILGSPIAIVGFLYKIFTDYSKRKAEKRKAANDANEKREVIKPVYRIARQHPTVEDLTLIDEQLKHPTPINGIRFDGLLKDKSVDFILENITRQRAIAVEIEFPDNSNFSIEPIVKNSLSDFINNMVINTHINGNLCVKDYLDQYHLKLIFEDIRKNRYQQVITYKNYRFQISDPELLNRP